MIRATCPARDSTAECRKIAKHGSDPIPLLFVARAEEP